MARSGEVKEGFVEMRESNLIIRCSAARILILETEVEEIGIVLPGIATDFILEKRGVR